MGRYQDGGFGVTSVLRRGLTRGSVALCMAPAEVGVISRSGNPSISSCDCLRFLFTVSEWTEGARDRSRMGCDRVSMFLASDWLTDEMVSNGIAAMKGSKSAMAFCWTHLSIQPGWIAFCERRNSPSTLRVIKDHTPSIGASTMMNVASFCSSSIPPFAYR